MTEENQVQDGGGGESAAVETGAPAAEGGDADEPGDGTNLVARVAVHDEALAEDVAARVERAEALAGEVERLEADIAEAEAEREELTERLQRTQADFQNYKKRAKKRQEQLRERATEELVEQVVEVRDDLHRALADESGDSEALREGVELTLREFDRVLDGEGVAEIAPGPGSEVDPARHEVLMRVESDQPEDAVAALYRPGYEMGDRVLRPAQVTVSDGEESDGEDGGGETGAAEEADDPEAADREGNRTTE